MSCHLTSIYFKKQFRETNFVFISNFLKAIKTKDEQDRHDNLEAITHVVYKTKYE